MATEPNSPSPNAGADPASTSGHPAAGADPASTSGDPTAGADPMSANVTREQRLVLTIAILASLVAFLDGTIVNVALPAMLRDLGGGIAMQQWVVDAYLITLGALILVAGAASDVYGRIRIMRAGLIGFGVASLIIALAPTAGVLIGARLLQGAAGALLVPSSLAIIMANFRGAASARAIGTWTAATSAAWVVGPIVGGLFVDFASWRWAFSINVLPVAVTLVLLARLSGPDVRRPDARINIPDALLCVAGLGGVVYALIEAPARGWSHASIWAPALVGAVALVAFVVRQGRSADPLMPLDLFRIRNFGWGNGATALIYGALGLNSFILSVYLQQGAGLSATAAGLASLPVVLLVMVLSSRMGALAGRLGPRGFMTVGPLGMALGSLLMLTVSEDFNYWLQVLPGIMLFGFGLAVTVAPLTSAILGAIDTARSGIASAVNNAVARIAGLVAVAMLGTIVAGMLDLDGFRRATVVVAVLMALGGLVSWAGIRNPRRTAPGATLDT